ncbi:hypothetical protein DIC66_12685 [Rhodoferax lacus]|uniref:Uncharacterized protein n=1 Tax=Rhodoferax lacus TaxID=2184758 RepID=A0A3E1RAV2_9BURK|nr:hypothetical protein [Rhodoferax lacus]RFO96494.1 hypothetical protein DIC66_12685 [Rhodoferax lacus]
MFIAINAMVGADIPEPRQRFGKRRQFLLAASLSTALLLTACGGGGEARIPVDFNIGVTVGGQLLSATPVAPGGSLALAVHAGQSVILDAGEPVVWTLLVGGSRIGSGVQIYYSGISITATPLNRSSAVLDTYARYPLLADVPVTLVATSTYDSVQVVTLNLLITN